jgi:DNA-binding CsgD family transcriptional regulator
MTLLLSPREIEVAKLVCDGRTSRTIAKLLKLSPSTISVHRRSVRLKLKADTTSDLIQHMLNKKLWEPPCEVSGSSS